MKTEQYRSEPECEQHYIIQYIRYVQRVRHNAKVLKRNVNAVQRAKEREWERFRETAG